MPKKFFRKYLPHRDVIIHNDWIKRLGPRLQEPSLWHINRRSCSGAIAVGVFCAFIPVPFQMALAAIAAVWLRVNILVAVPVVWISNPLTIPPMFYFCYLLGAQILGTPADHFQFELSLDWLLSELGTVWQPFLLGCLVAGLVVSLAAFVLTRILWRLHIVSHLKSRSRRLHNRTT